MDKQGANPSTSPRTGNQRGFTLVELVVVIAILGVLAGIAVPLVSNYLGTSKEQAWNADRDRIQAAVDAYVSSPNNVRYQGKRQYPIKGYDASGTLNTWGAADTSAALATPGSPVRGTKGGEPKWRDGGADGIRTEENLNAEVESLAGSGSGWYVVQVAHQGTNYAVDTRNYFIDFDKLTTEGAGALKLLDARPKSASPDNNAGATGSYSWYVNADGSVNALYYYFPTNGNAAGTGVTGGTSTAPGTNNGTDNRGFKSGTYP